MGVTEPIPISLLAAFRTLLVLAVWQWLSQAAPAQMLGELGAHDPSSLFYEDGRYYYYATGDRLAVRSSADLTTWTAEPAAFDAVPAWVPGAVPGYSGESLWAPDLIELNDTYYLYYSASIFGTRLSGIGYATSPTLNPNAPDYGWVDQGMVIGSGHSDPYNAIDPALMLDDVTGRLWMTWGSFNNGIYVKELNPANGQPLSSSPGVNVAAPGPTVEIEAASMLQRDGYYYLFVNWGGCCSGIDSTYNIRVGRSTSPTGPFVDRDGVDLLNGGGSLFLDDDGRKVGPGHFSLFSEGGQDRFSYHFYDADRVGAPTYALQSFHWTDDDWPRVAEAGGEWVGGVEAGWSDPTAWTHGTMPDGIGHVADFVGGPSPRSQRRVLMSSSRTIGTANFRGQGRVTIGEANGPTLLLNDSGGETATINVIEGQHTIATPVSAADALEINVPLASAGMTLAGQVTAPTLKKYGEGALTLAGSNSLIAGNLFVKRGSLAVEGSVTAGSFASVGQIVGESAVMSVRGNGVFTAQADLNIGDTGDAQTPATGVLLISEQGSVVAETGLYVGSGFFANTRAEGLIVQTGGTLTVRGAAGGELVIGGRGSDDANGAYELSSGTLTTDADVAIGSRGQGHFTQSGGQVLANSRISLGRHAASVGEWTINAGELVQPSTRSTFVVGDQGQGILRIEGEGVVEANGTVRLAEGPAATGEVRLRGGTLRTGGVLGGSGASTIIFDGGHLQAVRNSSSFLDGVDTALVDSGGVTLDTQPYDVEVGQPLGHAQGSDGTDGGLRKLGSGRLTLRSASTYRGVTTIDEGVLEVANAIGSATGSGGLIVADGASLVGGGAVSGTVEVSAGGTIDPGEVAATLTVGGLLLHGDASTAAHLAGGGAGSLITVTGNAALAGDLVVRLTPGADPNRTDIYPVLSAASLESEFTNAAHNTFVDEATGAGAFRVLYDGDNPSVLLTDYQPVRFLAGDFNGDGFIDASDYTVWRDHAGSPAGTLWNDPTRDAIGASQYEVWQANFGAALDPLASGVAAAVPEPGAGLLAAALLAACLGQRRSD